MSKIKDLKSRILSKIVVKPISWQCCQVSAASSVPRIPTFFWLTKCSAVTPIALIISMSIQIDGYPCNHKKCDRCQVSFENSGQADGAEDVRLAMVQSFDWNHKGNIGLYDDEKKIRWPNEEYFF
ncbi:hypothetical protein ONS95_002217 [Cadophora gregata]|uniref:uncharacterized protein n=1 Tax=Cadophora gregata TaxID=51156 RepID=UPI0026DD2644|nr:uncharacterized protein ONS95_002217 [Cadophora gregata]KAK0109529.1 hypothetical protein ONS95_002217 [Cadophora gregata]KAK0110845.1 hypothetical protein ONS96_002434 [Cadophora gregata f. sp. sojae]